MEEGKRGKEKWKRVRTKGKEDVMKETKRN